MPQNSTANDRRTSVDVIFDHLHEAIQSLKLLPGDKISEADIAAQFGVSRQPVRDAFSRLGSMDLLLIRPQRATEVKRFAAREIEKSRFVRAAVESEVLRRAARHCTPVDTARMQACLGVQKAIVDAQKYEEFGALDYDFHKTLCEIAQVPYAFEVISAEKANVDRLCMLSLSKEDRIEQLYQDHKAIAQAIDAHDEQAAVDAGMIHLSRLDATIEAISTQHPDYFDD